VTQEKVTFSFGKNWEQFIRTNFSEERIEIARQHLLNFLDMRDLAGKYFLDIGCGSGIHSLAAFKSSAQRIASFDVDPYSVATTQKIHEMYGSPPSWQIAHGSILEDTFLRTVEPADIVYSWGVLHHTGNVWQAIRNAATFLKPGSIFYIAIYDKTPDTPYWIDIKKKYNRSTGLGKKLMEFSYVWRAFFKTASLSRIKQSIAYINNYKKSRGMEFWTDVKDWLGGWPYEPATQEEICSFCEETLGLERIKVKTGEANIEYLFKKKTT
jgi:SAM-dependent methyltransferase